MKKFLYGLLITVIIMPICSCSNEADIVVTSTPTFEEMPEIYGRSASNKITDGKIAISGDWIYYSNSGLYKIRTDGTEKTKINDDDCMDINVVGNWIYYNRIATKKEQESLIYGIFGIRASTFYKVKTDGSKRQRVMPHKAVNATIVGDWVYYAYPGSLQVYRVKTDGTKNQRIISGNRSQYFIVDGDWIYYSNTGDRGSIYKIRTDGTRRTKLNNDIINSGGLIIAGDWIYYASTNASDRQAPNLYRVKKDGTGRMLLSDENTIGFTIYNDHIYYFRQNQDNKQTYELYRMSLEGTEKTQLHNMDNAGIYIVDDWIYYRNRSDNYQLYRMRIDGTGEQKLGGI